MLYKWMGQEINVGDIVADLWSHNTVPNILFYKDVSTWWNPVKYIMEKDGELPSANKLYTFPIVSGLNFYMYINYVDASHFKVGYIISPPPFDTSGLTYNPLGRTIDKNRPNEYDCLANGVAFLRMGVASATYMSWVGNIGISYGMVDPMTLSKPAVELGTGTYEMDEDLTPPRYVWTEYGECYRSHITVPQYTFFDMLGNTEKYKLLHAYGEEISSFDEDYAEPEGGEGGEYSFYSDSIGFAPLPSLSVQDSGIATMWNPNPSEMQAFTDFLWSDGFFDNILKLVADPMDNVIQFGVVPFPIPNEYLGTPKEVKVGNVGTGVNMTPLTKQYVQFDAGSITIPEAWRTCMDYEPMTTISMFIPAVGFVTMTANEIMKASKIQLLYNIDLLSGDCNAQVKVTKNFPKGVYLDSVIYHKNGNIMQQMPLTGANYGRMYTQLLHNAASFGASVMGGNILGAVDSAMNVPSLEVERTNGYTGSSAILGCEQPYIFLSQPVQVFDSLYPHYEGYPSYMAYKLGDLSGFTKVEELIDNTVEATETEKAEIERLLKEGVIL